MSPYGCWFGRRPGKKPRRLEVGDRDVQILSLAGSSDGNEAMRQQASEIMARIRGDHESSHPDDSQETS